MTRTWSYAVSRLGVLIRCPRRAALPLLIFTACAFPRPADIGDDAPGDAGIPTDPAATIRVSLSGDDANDGHLQPVKTLKHAIGLAAADSKVTHIVLATGTYSIATGETFPYTVPSNVTILGPAGGGATLDGTAAGPGITVDNGGLQDLDLQGFTTAITATGEGSLKNIRVLGSKVAVQAETAAKLAVDNLDVTGSAGACATGILLNGNAVLAASNYATRALGISFLAKDQSVATLSAANLAGSATCDAGVLQFASSGTLDIRDSLLDGGSGGIGISPPSENDAAHVTMTNAIVRNMDKNGLVIGNAIAEMTGGALSHTRETNLTVVGGSLSLQGVSISGAQVAFYVQDGNLTVRDCVISENQIGGDLGVRAIGDLGTNANPGGNVFKNVGVGLMLEGGNGTSLVQAIGNTWKPVQGASNDGKYAPGTTLPGPISCTTQDINICIQVSDESVQL